MTQPVAILLLCALAASAVSACSDDDKSSSGVDAGSLTDAGSVPVSADASLAADAGAADCVVAPQTHLELLNACTDAEKVTKNPTLPLLLLDGGLPPLP